MQTIDRSGFFRDDSGMSFLVTQGLSGNTLIAGKQCLFRLFMDTSNVDNNATFEVLIKNNSKTTAIEVSKDAMIIEQAQPIGPSVGLIVRGFVFPKEGTYSVSLTVYSGYGAMIFQIQNINLFFRQTKDIRLLVVPMDHAGVFEPTQEWYDDISKSMLRLGSMLPIRDCVQSSLNGAKLAGLRYVVGSKCDGWTSGYYDCVYKQTEAINNGKGDDIDVTIEFRWGFYPPDYNPPGDPAPGGNSGRPPAPYDQLRRAACVAGPYYGLAMTAPCFAQEIGHNFGLEPPASPHFQDPNDPGHSKDGQIIDPFAFDFVNLRNYYPAPSGHFLGDVMNNFGQGAWQGANDVLYNAFDWEFLRQQFLGLNSTGTESHPAFSDPCNQNIIAHLPPILPIRRFYPRGDPAEWLQFLKESERKGQFITWGRHGLILTDGKENKSHDFVEVHGLRSILKVLQQKGVQEVYIHTGTGLERNLDHSH